MKNIFNKNLNIILILFIFIIASLSFVSASELDEDIQAFNDTDEYLVELDEDFQTENSDSDQSILSSAPDTVLAAGVNFYVSADGNGNGLSEKTPCSFDYALQNSAEGTTIFLQKGTYSFYNKNINKAISIIGTGNVIIDADKKGRIFTISASNVVLDGLTMINGHLTSYGGTIYWTGAGGKLTNSNIISSYGTYGGAICWKGADGIITNSNFTSNEAYSSYGGAIKWDGVNGFISDCQFSDNQAKSSGGAIYWKGATGQLINTDFTNHYGASGGTVYWFGADGIISNCKITDSVASSQAGAIYWSGANGKLLNTDISNVSSVSYGAIRWSGSDAQLINCNFYNSSSTANKGSLYFSSNNPFVNYCTFVNNEAPSAGAIQINSLNPIIQNSVFINNIALSDSGTINFQGTNGRIVNCTFINNTVASYGGAVYISGKNSTVVDSTFINNFAQKDGGAVFIITNELGSPLNNLKFYNNTANRGSAIYSNRYISITNSIFKGNKDSSSLTHTQNSNNITMEYTPVDTYSIGIYYTLSSNISFSNVRYYWNGKDLNTDSAMLYKNVKQNVQIIFQLYDVSKNKLLKSLNLLTDENGGLFISIDSKASFYHAIAYHDLGYDRKIINDWYFGDTVYVSPDGKGSGFSTSTPTTLDNAIEISLDKIVLLEGTYDILTPISIYDSLTFIGYNDNVYLDGQGKNNIFKVYSDKIHFEKINFVNGLSASGGAIYFYKTDSRLPSSVTISNCYFMNNLATAYGGAIYFAYLADVEFINSTFFNNSARYGGSVAIASTVNSTFKNCEFIYSKASLGGGAVYSWGGHHNFTDSLFAYCVSQYGGGILSLYDNINLLNTYFSSNAGLAFGGALYKKSGNITVDNCNFDDNYAYYDGGAVYVSNGNASVTGSVFNRNIGGYGGGAMHMLASTVVNSKNTLINSTSNSDNGYVKTDYFNSFLDIGDYPLFVADTSNFNGTIPSYFSLVDNGWVTSVKNQGSLGICWDYAVMAILESAIKKATGITYDFSENNVKNLISMYSDWGRTRGPNDGGYIWDALSYLADSLGPTLEVIDPTSSYGFSPLLESVVHVSNIGIATRNRTNPLDNDEVKIALMKYGAVRMSFNTAGHSGYNYYQNDTTSTTHAVAIVGWDDNYSASNFPNNCPGDGAWIVKNSWGSTSGKNGYIYISYYDTTAAWSGLAYVILNDTVKYDRVYQYDYTRYSSKSSGANVSWYKNIYTSVKNEAITAFSTFFLEKTSWEAYVYLGNELVHTQKGTTQSPGYFTFNFDKVIPVEKGQQFTVALKVNTTKFPYIAKSSLNTSPGGKKISYYSKDGVTWTDLNKQVACLKVFTQNMPGSLITIDSVTNVYYGESTTVNFSVLNKTAVSYELKNSAGTIVSSASNIKTNSITFNNLALGKYTLNIVNSNSDKYIGYTCVYSFEIIKHTSLVVIDKIASVSYGSNVTVNFNVYNLTGLTYNVKTSSLDEIIPDTQLNSQDPIILSSLDAGNYIISISNAESENYMQSSASAEFTVSKVTPTITISKSNVVYPKDVVITVKSTIAGSYTVKVGDVSQVVSLTANTKKKVTFKGLNASKYTVLVEYGETVNYNKASKSTTVTVSKAASSIVIDPIENATCQSEINIKYTVTGKTELTYKLINTDTDKEVTITNTCISDDKLTFTNLDVGNYTVIINNDENTNYLSSQANASFKISKYTPKVTLNVVNVTYGSDIVVNLLSDVAGKYIVKVSDETQDVTLNENENRNILFKNYKTNEKGYNVEVRYTGDKNYNSVLKTDLVYVFKADSKVSLSKINDGVYNTLNPAFKVGVVNKTSCEYIIYKNSDVVGSGDFSNLDSGLSKLTAGDYTLTVINNAGDNYKSSDASVIFKILKANSKITAGEVNNIIYANDLNINYDVVNKTSLTYKLINKNTGKEVQITKILNNQIILSNLIAGDYSLTLINNENDNYKSDNLTINFSVLKALPDLLLNEISQVNDHKIIISYTINDEATGNFNITIYKDNKIVSNNITSIKSHEFSLNPGNYSLCVEYMGDNNFEKTYKTVDFTILQHFSDIKVNNLVNITYSQSLTVNPVLINGSGGNYQLIYNDMLIKSGSVSSSLTFSDLAAGDYKLFIVNYGDVNHLSSNLTVGFSVFKALPDLTLNEISDVSYPGKTHISYESADGNFSINVYKANKLVLSRLTSLKSLDLDLDAGSYFVSVEYSGSQNYSKVIKNTTFTVYPSASAIKVIRYNNISYGQIMDVCVELINGSGGSFQLIHNNVVVKSGDFVNLFSFKNLAVGNYTLFIKNNADDNHVTSNTTLYFTVSKATPNIIISQIKDVVYGNNVDVSFKVNNTDVNIFNVSIFKDNKLITYKVINSTSCFFEGLGSGNYTVYVSCSGDADYNSCVNESSFSVNKASSSVRITLMGSFNYLSFSYASFKCINGTGFYEIVQNSTVIKSGNLSTPVLFSNLNAGVYTITAYNNGDDNHRKSIKSTSFTIKKITPSIAINPISDVNYSDIVNISFRIDNSIKNKVNVSVLRDDLVLSKIINTTETGFSNLDAGNYTVKVQYLGDDNYLTASATSTFKVNKLAFGGVISNISNIAYGEVLKVNVSGINTTSFNYYLIHANKTDVFTSDSIELNDLAADDYLLRIVFDGDVNHEAGIVESNFTVFKADPNFIIKDADDISWNQTLNISYTISELASGYIKVLNNIYNLSDDILIDGLEVGDYDLCVYYLGDANFTSASHNITFKVKPVVSSVIIDLVGDNKTADDEVSKVADNSKVVNNKVKPVLVAFKKVFKSSLKVKKYKVTLKGVKKAKITLKINKKTYKAITNNKGKAVFKIKIKTPGVYKAKILFKGNSKFTSVSKKFKIVIKK